MTVMEDGVCRETREQRLNDALVRRELGRHRRLATIMRLVPDVQVGGVRHLPLQLAAGPKRLHPLVEDENRYPRSSAAPNDSGGSVSP